MSHTTSHPAAIPGHAVVHQKNGDVIVGLATYDTRAIHIDGSLRVISTIDGESGVVTYRRRRRRTIPLHAIQVVFWDDD